MPYEMHGGSDAVHGDEAHDVGYKDHENVKEVLDETIHRDIFHPITVTDAGGVDITWSMGEIYTAAGKILRIDAEATPQACTDHAINYLFYDHSGGGMALTLSATAPNMTEDILVATINVADGDIHDLHHKPIYTEAVPAVVAALADLFPSIITEGLIVSAHAGGAAFDVDMSQGVYYHRAHERAPVAAQDSTVDNLTRWYQSGGAAWTHVPAQTIIDTGFWNTGNNIATAVNAAKYYRSLFFVDSDGINWVYPTAEYNTVAQAIAGADPVLPAGLTDHPKSTVVILRGNDASFPTAGGAQWIDVRPIIGGGISGDFSDHGNLSGLSDNDHPQYLLSLGGVFSVRNPVAGKYYLIAKAAVAMTITRISGRVVDGTDVTVEYWINDENQLDEDGATELYGGGGKTFVVAHDVDTHVDFNDTNEHLAAHQTLWAKVDDVTGAVTQLLTDYEWEPT